MDVQEEWHVCRIVMDATFAILVDGKSSPHELLTNSTPTASPRPLAEIDADIKVMEEKIIPLLREVTSI